MTTALGVVAPLTDPEFQSALDAFTGAIYGSVATANLQHTSFYLSELAGRFRSAMTPGQPLSSSGFADAKPEQPLMLVAYEQRGSGDGIDAPCRRCVPTRRAWISGYGLSGAAFSDGNADGFGYDLAGGTQFAVDHAFSRNWKGGMWGNMSWGSVDSTTLGERASLESYHFGGHLVGFDGRDSWIAIAGVGYNEADIRRTITSGGLNQSAQGDVDGVQTILYLERGRSYDLRGWRVQPYAALQYLFLHQGDLVETGGQPLRLDVGHLDAHSLRSILGKRVATTFCTPRGRRVTPEFRAAWMHEFLDTNQALTSTFAGSAGSFAVRGVDLGRDWATVGGGLSLQTNRHARAFAGYDTQFNDNQTLHTATGGVEFVW